MSLQGFFAWHRRTFARLRHFESQAWAHCTDIAVATDESELFMHKVTSHVRRRLRRTLIDAPRSNCPSISFLSIAIYHEQHAPVWTASNYFLHVLCEWTGSKVFHNERELLVVYITRIDCCKYVLKNSHASSNRQTFSLFIIFFSFFHFLNTLLHVITRGSKFLPSKYIKFLSIFKL